ncbi:hypothetical protein BZA77DRAFT_311679 [Pyronema omphalodes]|nr:hypothetical protein BZA77DRAFT_311679 [Pyronema omphalodes]
MTDANGFYRPRGLPQDLEFTDDEDYSGKPLASDTESCDESTLYSRPSSSTSYLRPDQLGGARTPGTMSVYRHMISSPPPASDYTPSVLSHYTGPSPEYTPQDSQYTPATSQYTPAASQYTPPTSQYTPPASQYTPASSDIRRSPESSLYSLPQQTPLSSILTYGTVVEASGLPLPFNIQEPHEKRRGFCVFGRFKRFSNYSSTKDSSLFRRFFIRSLCSLLILVILFRMSTPYFPQRNFSLPCTGHQAAFKSHGTLSIPPNDSFTFLEIANIGLDGYLQIKSDPSATHTSLSYDLISSAPHTISFTSSADSIKMLAPHSHECVTAKLTLTLPPVLNKLKITTTTLPITLDDSISLNHLEISTSHAGVSSHAAVNQTTKVSLKSGTITGVYDLGTSLKLETIAGAITASIHPLNLTHPTATLDAKTISGSISLKLKLDDNIVPGRNYSVTANTVSGGIHGTYLFGSFTGFKTTSGIIDVGLWPVFIKGSEDREDLLTTETKNGVTDVGFIGGLNGKRVRGSHKADTGGVQVAYPGDWEGSVQARTKLGRVEVAGIEIDRREWGSIDGHVGDKEKGGIEVRSMIGEVMVRVG